MFYLISLSHPCQVPFSVSLLLPLSSLSILLHLLPGSYPPLNVFAQSGFAQCGNTLRTFDPKWSLAAMSGSIFALAPPMIFIRLQSPFLFAAYATGAAYAAGCRGPPATLLYGPLALSSPLNVELIFPMHLIANLCCSFFLEGRQ